jgi:putative SOS response-associated peptidase YedK
LANEITPEFKGESGTKSKPIPGPHLVYGFLTTAPNAVVAPIHPKAMPVILTTEEECDVWMRAPWKRSGSATATAPKHHDQDRRQRRARRPAARKSTKPTFIAARMAGSKLW